MRNVTNSLLHVRDPNPRRKKNPSTLAVVAGLAAVVGGYLAYRSFASRPASGTSANGVRWKVTKGPTSFGSSSGWDVWVYNPGVHDIHNYAPTNYTYVGTRTDRAAAVRFAETL